MEHQIAFFNNINQIIFDYTPCMNYHNLIMNNYMKDNNFDTFNDVKSIVTNCSNYDNLENYIIIDTLTYNKLNIIKFNIY